MNRSLALSLADLSAAVTPFRSPGDVTPLCRTDRPAENCGALAAAEQFLAAHRQGGRLWPVYGATAAQEVNA